MFGNIAFITSPFVISCSLFGMLTVNIIFPHFLWTALARIR